MSSGQMPRRPEFFPLMKWRARKRCKPVVRLWNAQWELIDEPFDLSAWFGPLNSQGLLVRELRLQRLA
jgi:hypothetical protein